MMAYMNAESIQKTIETGKSPLLQQKQAKALAEG